MSSLDALAAAAAAGGPVCFAVGFFDGLHLGHQALLRAACACARDSGGQAWALTFDRHPASLLRPESAPPLLMSLEQKLDGLRDRGIAGCVALPFTRDLANLTPEAFVAGVHASVPEWRAVTVGANWRFGRDRAGDVRTLEALARPRGVRVEIVPPVLVDGAPASSSRVRTGVRAGNLESARRLLGRPFAVRGRVEHGRGRGRGLGIPTANLAPASDVLPPPGVYAAWTHGPQGRHPAVLNLGRRPTFGDQAGGVVFEVHLLDFDGDLYGTTLEVSFAARLRDERTFAGAAELVAQVREDIRAARASLAEAPKNACRGIFKSELL